MEKQETPRGGFGRPEPKEIDKKRISEWQDRTDLAKLAYAPAKRLANYRKLGSQAPSALPLFVGSLGELGDAFVGALRIYWGYLRGDTFVYAVGKAPEHWDEFERGLGRLFAFLLMALADCQGDAARQELISLVLLQGLKFKSWRGRPRKQADEVSDMIHGRNMNTLWINVLRLAWNAKDSLQTSGQNPVPHLERSFPPDVVQAVMARRATRESSLARLYAERQHISVGRARNALRAYREHEKEKRTPTS